MTVRSITTGLCIAPAVFLLAPWIATVSCQNSNQADAGPGPCQNGTIQLVSCEPDDAGVVHETFTDEACDGLDTAESRMAAIPDDTQAPAIDAPTENESIAATPPFTFVWHPTGFGLRALPPRVRAFAWTDDLSRWTTLLPAADAHCPPFGGVGYAVIFQDHSGQEVVRAETATHSYTPTPDAWARLRAIIGTLTVFVEVARFSDNVVTEGPYIQRTPRHFVLIQ